METAEKGFPPVAGKWASALILGSWPSPKSRQQGFYYGHPQNRFWPLLARLTGEPVPTTIPEKQALILRHGLALWDTLESCTITGASDASIQDPVPNDVAALARRLGVKAVFCNGAAAWKFYQKFHREAVGLDAIKLPSTSPANAAFNMDRLAREWAVLVPYLE